MAGEGWHIATLVKFKNLQALPKPDEPKLELGLISSLNKMKNKIKVEQNLQQDSDLSLVEMNNKTDIPMDWSKRLGRWI